MGKGDDFFVSETGNWNVADRFSKVKIMLPMAKCELYEDLAQFGHDDILEELIEWNTIPEDIIKIKALKRLIKELIKICKNTKFAMKKLKTKDDMDKHEKNLKRIDELMPLTFKSSYSGVTKIRSIQIIPENFQKVLSKVLDIKEQMNDPLNKNDLIFLNREEFDPKAHKEALLERMKTKG